MPENNDREIHGGLENYPFVAALVSRKFSKLAWNNFSWPNSLVFPINNLFLHKSQQHIDVLLKLEWCDKWVVLLSLSRKTWDVLFPHLSYNQIHACETF